MRTTNQWQAVIALLRRLSDRGIIEPGQLSKLNEALRDFEHATKVRDWKRQEKAVDKVARTFLKRFDSER